MNLLKPSSGMIRDVEVDGSVDAFGAFADEGERCLVALEQRRQQVGHERLLQDVANGIEVSSGMSRGMKSRVLGGFDDQGKLHGGLGHLHRSLGLS